MVEHTKNPKEQVEHCLIRARKIVWGDSLSVSVATHYKVVTEKYNHVFIEKVNISQMQALSSLEMIAQDYGWDA